MDPVHAWTSLPERKPLHVTRGFVGGLTVVVAATVSTALAGRAPTEVASVAVGALIPLVALMLLVVRTNRQNRGRGSR